MQPERLATLAALRRARDAIDRDYAEPLDVPTMAATAHMSPAHFSRQFSATYGETPYSYLMTRRIERAMTLLREGMGVTDACMAVGATSLGSFSSSFRRITGMPPSVYREREAGRLAEMPTCAVRVSTRPRKPGRDAAAHDAPAATAASAASRTSGSSGEAAPASAL